MNKNAPGDGNKFLTQLMLLSINRKGITRRKFKTPMAFFYSVGWSGRPPGKVETLQEGVR
jgi:hypothetical protein